MRHKLFALPILLALAALGAAPRQDPPKKAERHVVVVSIDGLRPEFYLDDAWKTPTLKRLVKAGAHAKGVEGVFPSVTYPSHASMVTGVYPAKHGIISNTKWSEEGPSKDWYWETADLRAPPVWKTVHDAGKTVAIVYWPTSVGADVDWRIPEKWADGSGTLELLRKLSTKGLLDEIEKGGKFEEADFGEDKNRVDRTLGKACAWILREKKPALTFLHILNVDHEEHSYGREGEKVHEAVENADAVVAELVKATEDAGIADSTTFIITGDHGFKDITKEVAPNVLFAEAGLLPKSGPWQAIAHASGAQAAIHVKGGADVEKKVMELLKKTEDDCTIVTKEELKKMGGDPGAFCALVGKAGVTVGGRRSGELVGKAGLKGNHGYLPTDPQLHTGLILYGRGVKAGASIELAHLIDVAPTIAKLIGVEMKDIDGKALDGLLAP